MSKRESEISQMRHFGRVLRMVWPHRKYVIIAFVAMLGLATAYTFSIATMFSILRILVDRENIHNMVNLTVMQDRLGVNLGKSGQGIFVTDISPHSRLYEKGGVRAGDYITSVITPEKKVYQGWNMAAYLANLSDQDVIMQVPWIHKLVHFFKGKSLKDIEDRQIVTLNIFTMEHGKPKTRTIQAEYGRQKLSYNCLLKAVSYIPPEPPNATETEQKYYRMKMLGYILVFFVTLSIFGNICRFIGEYHGEIVGARTLLDLRRVMYAKTMMLPMSFFVTRGVADTMSRFTYDSQDVLKALRTLFGKVLREPMKAIGVIIVALCIEPRLTLLVVVIAPLAAVLFRKFGKWIRRANEKLLKAYGRLTGALESTLTGIRVVKAYTMENQERKRYFRVEREILRQVLHIERVNALSSPVLEVLGVLAMSGGMIWIMQEILSGRLNPGDLLGLLIAMAAVLDPVRKLSNVYNDIQKANAAAKRVFELIDMQTEFQLSTGTKEVNEPKSGIEFKDLVFSYPNSDHPALDRVGIAVEAGKVYAVVGPNGSGKTTLVSMLLRFFDPAEGAVLWDGIDLRELQLRDLRRHISYVAQDAVIFADTVASNIAYGYYQSPREEIIAAAKKAHAHDFIERLPKGYDTILGEHGTSLSGGERQRLAIARAILRNAPVLIFDEATSQIDAESEKNIQEAIEEFLPGRTALIIAHRFSTIKKADKIVVMDRGKVVACGSHQELIEASPLYQTLYQTQLKGLQQNT